MSGEDYESLDAEAELKLLQEYRDVVGQFRYVVETERRFYLANQVRMERRELSSGFFFEVELSDVWVWDSYRSNRFVKSVHIVTFRDVNVEEMNPVSLSLSPLTNIMGAGGAGRNNDKPAPDEDNTGQPG